MSESNNYQNCLDCYIQLIDLKSEVERKGKSMPYTSLNGHMFSFLSKDGEMGLRLAKKDIEHFVKQFNSTLMEQHGRTMKEFVSIPQSLLEDANQLLPFLELSIEYTSRLKPKASKKK